MMRSKCRKIPISFSRAIYIYVALLLLLIPVRLLFAAVVSATMHEICHIAAVRLMGLQVYSIHIGVRGAVIRTQPMKPWQELLCALAGPTSGLLLLLFVRRMPVIALTGAVQSLYNLLPIYPTDGGRAFRCAAQIILPDETAWKIAYLMEMITLSVIMAFCIYGSVWLHLGIIPILFAASLLLQSATRNNSCKA